jgi:hypothetical protein
MILGGLVSRCGDGSADSGAIVRQPTSLSKLLDAVSLVVASRSDVDERATSDRECHSHRSSGYPRAETARAWLQNANESFWRSCHPISVGSSGQNT